MKITFNKVALVDSGSTKVLQKAIIAYATMPNPNPQPVLVVKANYPASHIMTESKEILRVSLPDTGGEVSTEMFDIPREDLYADVEVTVENYDFIKDIRGIDFTFHLTNRIPYQEVLQDDFVMSDNKTWDWS